MSIRGTIPTGATLLKKKWQNQFVYVKTWSARLVDLHMYSEQFQFYQTNHGRNDDLFGC